jgi:hypothetical protein
MNTWLRWSPGFPQLPYEPAREPGLYDQFLLDRLFDLAVLWLAPWKFAHSHETVFPFLLPWLALLVKW